MKHRAILGPLAALAALWGSYAVASVGAPVPLNTLVQDTAPKPNDIIPILPSPFTGNLQYTTVQFLGANLNFNSTDNNYWSTLALGAYVANSGNPIATIAIGDYAGANTLNAQSSVMIGHLNSQYAQNFNSLTSVGAFASTGARRVIPAMPFIYGSANSVFGEAANTYAAGVPQSNAIFGFNSCFSCNSTLGMATFGASAGETSIESQFSTLIGPQAERFGNMDYSLVGGYYAAAGNVNFDFISQPCTIGVGGNCGIGTTTFPVPHADLVGGTQIFFAGDAVSAGGLTPSYETITGVTANTVTVSNNSYATSTLPTDSLIDTTTGKSYFTTGGVVNGGAKWYFPDTSGFTVGDSITDNSSGATITGVATIVSINLNNSIVLSKTANRQIFPGTIFYDLTNTITTGIWSVPGFSPSATTASGSAVWTFTGQVANYNLHVGDVVYIPGASYPGTTIAAIDTVGNTITLSEPSTIAVGPTTFLYDISNVATGQFNTILGPSAFQLISGNASTDTGLGNKACADVAYTGNNLLCLGANTTLSGAGASNEASIANSIRITGTNVPATSVTAAQGLFKPIVTTVGALPTCNTAAKGLQAVVTDATAPTYLATLTGGGAVVTPVVCGASAWNSY